MGLQNFDSWLSEHRYLLEQNTHLHQWKSNKYIEIITSREKEVILRFYKIYNTFFKKTGMHYLQI